MCSISHTQNNFEYEIGSAIKLTLFGKGRLKQRQAENMKTTNRKVIVHCYSAVYFLILGHIYRRHFITFSKFNLARNMYGIDFIWLIVWPYGLVAFHPWKCILNGNQQKSLYMCVSVRLLQLPFYLKSASMYSIDLYQKIYNSHAIK